MKKLFSTPKKAIILVICIVVVMIAAGVMAFNSALITKAEAKSIALKDAGLSEAEASALRVRFEFDDGRFQYEVDFYNNGTEYEYLIQAKNGEIIAKDIDGKGNGNPDMQDAGNQPSADENSSVQPREDAENQPAANGNNTAQPQEDSLDEAKAAALRDAGLSDSDVTFKRQSLITAMEHRYMTLNFILLIQNTIMKSMLPTEQCLKRILSSFRSRRTRQQTVP